MHPLDVVLAARLLHPAGTIAQLADELGIAPSQVHAGLKRLGHAGLLRTATRSTNARALGEFILFGIRYVFPASRGPLAEGVPTAYSAPPLAAEIDAVDVVVWPVAPGSGMTRGFSVTPLYRRAHMLVSSSPSTYRVLTLIDAMRLGEPRARNAARSHLELELAWRPASAAGSISPSTTGDE